MNEKVTIHDVAEHANVSIATVSRVLNELGNVKESTRDRVYQAMKEVGYQAAAQSEKMQEQEKRILLIFVTALGNFFTGRELDGIIETANEEGYECVVYKLRTQKYSLEDMSALAHAVGASGILMSLPNVPVEVMEKLAQMYPVVQFSEYARGCDVPYVSIDDTEAGKRAVNFLIKQGCRRIAMINGPLRYKYAQGRLDGYLTALREAGIEENPLLIVHQTEQGMDGTIAAAEHLFDTAQGMDGVFAISDLAAAAVLRVANQRGFRVPEDLALISFEDSDFAQVYTPSFTAIQIPAFHIGKLAARLLIDRLHGNFSSPPQINLQINLTIRQSTSV